MAEAGEQDRASRRRSDGARWPGGRRTRCAPPGVAPPSRIMRSARTRDGFDIGDVVHQVERLQRRVGAGLAHDAGFAAGGVEGHHRGRRRRCASRTCTGCGGTGLRRGPARSLRRRSSFHRPAGWYGFTDGPPIFSTSSPADGQRLVANHLGRQAEARAARQQAILRIALQQLGRGLRRLPVGRARHDQSSASPSRPSRCG